MKYSKLIVAGVAALALGGCYSVPTTSEAPAGDTGPVGSNNSAGSSDTTVGMAGEKTKPDGTGTYETKAKGSTESASK
ncbi:MAG TPA: hypothetical protein VK572_04885 [Burkholderiales bacterium]|nr:hypothetical protein [Burkholderiales bacterium]